MRYFTITTLLLASLLSVYCDTVPFLNVYMKAYDTKTHRVEAFYWGPSGNITFYLNETNPEKSSLRVSVFETLHNSLNQSQLTDLKAFVKYTKVVNFVWMEFQSTQLALSEYDKKYCGLFSDIEYTFDIDMPINPIGKDESSNWRLEFSFLFDLTYQGSLEKTYSFLDALCRKRIK